MLIIVYYYYVGSCGKLLKDMDAAEFHAAKTGHANFAESTEEKKPLTAEEKEEQKAKLAVFLSPVLYSSPPYACTPSASLEHMRSTVKILVPNPQKLCHINYFIIDNFEEVTGFRDTFLCIMLNNQ